MPGIRVLLVEDHELVAETVTTALRARGGLEVVAHATTARSGRELVRATRPDVTLWDLGLPDAEGFDPIAELSSGGHTIVVLSGWPEETYGGMAMRAGASAYVCKTQAFRNLVSAIEAAAAGERWLSPALTAAAVDGLWPDPRKRPSSTGLASLTNRETEVLALIGRGMGLVEMSEFLGISAKTIDTHRRHLREKLGLETGRHLTVFAGVWYHRCRGL